MKRSVVLCGSQQKKEGLYKFYGELSELGIACLKPDFEGRPPEFLAQEESERIQDPTYRLHLESFVRAHLERIRAADICFVYNADGKFGVNTRLEFDYARTHGKPIFSLLPLPGRHQTYVESLIPSARELLPWLGEYIALVGEPHHTDALEEWGRTLRDAHLIPIVIADLSPRSLHRLETADAVYIYNLQERLSEDLVALLGLAVALAKPIYAYVHDPVEVCCNTFFHPQLVRTPEELIAMLYPNRAAKQTVFPELTA